ncbi:MAG: hypothetical protein WAV73_04130 [Candidatus Moraniibacteriota bacterium]
MQKHLNKILVFVINILLMTIAVLVIKNQDQKSLIMKTETNSTLDPIDPNIMASQDAISADRENKLRALNSTPQELKKQQITTTTNNTVTKPSSSGSSSKTTKVS